ncbi:PREDICTED: probable aquaporin NIP5-1 [Erythranthe guttata]|uniref:probable aquaporin NIP5-1 n=1 Tax=Erythranthe guttata TaxID=4155 RepID=UPI00064D7A12|nr:PREDICTED: probable aquaporin NIP5-1 [Erythranthe guttata]|eukprot:XP_012844965.1 PREDICTED: probable aquaporin NIP5-1 [Erythranthe guttata]
MAPSSFPQPLMNHVLPIIRSNATLARKVGAEFVGTFILIFAAAGGPILNEKYNGVETLIGNALCAGLAVMIVILSIGHISGAHLNPSVSIAFAALRHFPWVEVPAYLAAQICGAICASFALKGCFHPFLSGGVTVPSSSVTTGQAFALEFLTTYFLLFVIIALATDTRAVSPSLLPPYKHRKQTHTHTELAYVQVGELAGIGIGAIVMLDILVAGSSTGASMNPARTLGPAIAAGNYKSIWIYIVAPTLGAVAGAATYTLLKLRPQPDEQVRSFPTV